MVEHTNGSEIEEGQQKLKFYRMVITCSVYLEYA